MEDESWQSNLESWRQKRQEASKDLVNKVTAFRNRQSLLSPTEMDKMDKNDELRAHLRQLKAFIRVPESYMPRRTRRHHQYNQNRISKSALPLLSVKADQTMRTSSISPCSVNTENEICVGQASSQGGDHGVYSIDLASDRGKEKPAVRIRLINYPNCTKAPRLGMTLACGSGVDGPPFFIETISSGSMADKGKLKVGDEIFSIDNICCTLCADRPPTICTLANVNKLLDRLTNSNRAVEVKVLRSDQHCLEEIRTSPSQGADCNEEIKFTMNSKSQAGPGVADKPLLKQDFMFAEMDILSSPHNPEVIVSPPNEGAELDTDILISNSTDTISEAPLCKQLSTATNILKNINDKSPNICPSEMSTINNIMDLKIQKTIYPCFEMHSLNVKQLNSSDDDESLAVSVIPTDTEDEEEELEEDERTKIEPYRHTSLSPWTRRGKERDEVIVDDDDDEYQSNSLQDTPTLPPPPSICVSSASNSEAISLNCITPPPPEQASENSGSFSPTRSDVTCLLTDLPNGEDVEDAQIPLMVRHVLTEALVDLAEQQDIASFNFSETRASVDILNTHDITQKYVHDERIAITQNTELSPCLYQNHRGNELNIPLISQINYSDDFNYCFMQDNEEGSQQFSSHSEDNKYVGCDVPSILDIYESEEFRKMQVITRREVPQVFEILSTIFTNYKLPKFNDHIPLTLSHPCDHPNELLISSSISQMDSHCSVEEMNTELSEATHNSCKLATQMDLTDSSRDSCPPLVFEDQFMSRISTHFDKRSKWPDFQAMLNLTAIGKKYRCINNCFKVAENSSPSNDDDNDITSLEVVPFEKSPIQKHFAALSLSPKLRALTPESSVEIPMRPSIIRVPGESPHLYDVPKINILHATSEYTDGMPTRLSESEDNNVEKELGTAINKSDVVVIKSSQSKTMIYEERITLEHIQENPNSEQKPIHLQSVLLVDDHQSSMNPFQMNSIVDYDPSIIRQLLVNPKNEINEPTIVENTTVVHQAPITIEPKFTVTLNQPCKSPVSNRIVSHTESLSSWAHLRQTIPAMTSSSALVENNSKVVDKRRSSLSIRGRPSPAVSADQQKLSPPRPPRLNVIGTWYNCAGCNQQLGTSDLMIVEQLNLFFHLACFICSRCGIPLSDGQNETAVRIRHGLIYCYVCYHGIGKNKSPRTKELDPVFIKLNSKYGKDTSLSESHTMNNHTTCNGCDHSFTKWKE